jgi:hypothetical protein
VALPCQDYQYVIASAEEFAGTSKGGLTMKSRAIAPSSINVGCLVMRVVLGDVGKGYQHLQESYLSKSGPEWTANRAKALWNIANLLRNGDKELALQVERENSIAHHRNGLPKGLEGVVVGRYVRAQRPAVIKRQAAVLRWYTSLKLNQQTPKQEAKAVRTISSPSKSQLCPGSIRSMGRSHMDSKLTEVATLEYGLTSKRKIDAWKADFKARIQSYLKDTWYADRLYATSKYYSRNKVPSEMKGVPYSSMCMSFMTEPWLPPELDERTPCQEMRNHIRGQEGWSNDDQRFAGKITILQEQGCKPRIVAQPSAWLQLAFRPLHDALAHCAEELFPDASCVKNQVSGADKMMLHQMRGLPCFCSDLSSATDRFPIEYSLGILDALGLTTWAHALERVVMKEFKCDFAPNGSLRYTVGQPMGLCGSFPLFHLSNLCLAYAADLETFRKNVMEAKERQIQVFLPGSTSYQVLGDDVVFADERVSTRYNQYLSLLGVDRSEAKCYNGNLAEFAGFMSVRTNKGVATFRPYKPSDGGYARNPIQLLDSIGVRVKRIKKRQAYWDKQWQSFSYTRPFRDLALESLIPMPGTDDGPVRSTFRGDSKTLVNMANVLAMTSDAALPDLSGSTKINRIPLFRERGMFDYYGYNPEQFAREDRWARLHPSRRPALAISRDPLIRAERSGYLQEIYAGLKSTEAVETAGDGELLDLDENSESIEDDELEY